MHVHFEQNNSTRCDCTVQCLSWMGKVPDGIPDADCWKLNRAEYYMEGWLASGNASAVVGVTFTTSHCRKYDAPTRSNFNLRGHRSEVSLKILFAFFSFLFPFLKNIKKTESEKEVYYVCGEVALFDDLTKLFDDLTIKETSMRLLKHRGLI